MSCAPVRPCPPGGLGVPRYPGLSPRHLTGRGSAASRFPFTAPRRSAHFLARNGLWHAVGLLGLRAGDRLLLPAYNCGIEVAVLLRRGLVLDFYPIGADLRPVPGAIEAASRPDTKAVYAIHYFGFPQPLEESRGVAARLGIPLIEDCALALLSVHGGAAAGSTGAVSIFSLTKFLPVPDGGLLVLNRPDLGSPPPGRSPHVFGTCTRTLNLLVQGLEGRRPRIGRATRGLVQIAGRRVARPLGLRGNDTAELEPHTLDWRISAISRTILRRLDFAEVARRRRVNYQRLLERLAPWQGLRPLAPVLDEGTVPLSLPVRVHDNESVASALCARGIGAAATWRCAHPAIPVGSFGETDDLRRQVVELPIHQDLEERHLELIARGVREVLGRPRSVARVEKAQAPSIAGVWA